MYKFKSCDNTLHDEVVFDYANEYSISESIVGTFSLLTWLTVLKICSLEIISEFPIVSIAEKDLFQGNCELVNSVYEESIKPKGVSFFLVMILIIIINFYQYGK